MAPKDANFFLGAYTSQGYISRSDQLADVQAGWKLLYMNGGPDNTASEMLRQMLEHTEKTEPVEIIHCPANTGKIESLILPDRKLALTDGASAQAKPHKLIIEQIKNIDIDYLQIIPSNF